MYACTLFKSSRNIRNKRAYEKHNTSDTASGALKDSIRAQELTNKTMKPNGVVRAEDRRFRYKWRTVTLEAEELERRAYIVTLKIRAQL